MKIASGGFDHMKFIGPFARKLIPVVVSRIAVVAFGTVQILWIGRIAVGSVWMRLKQQNVVVVAQIV